MSKDINPQHNNLPMAAGILAALGASLCCVGPFVLLTLGISGAWISNLTLLEPLQPIFVVTVLGLFSWAGWKIYRPVQVCEPGTPCAKPQVRRRRQIIFWLAALVALMLVTSQYWIPLFI